MALTTRRCRRLAAPCIEEGTAAVAFGSAKLALQAALLTEEGLAKLTKWIAEHAGILFDVHSITLELSLRDALRGKLFAAQLDLVVVGLSLNFSLDFDVHNVLDFVETFFSRVLDSAKHTLGI